MFCILLNIFYMNPLRPKQSEILPKFLEEGISEMQMKDFLDKNYARINSYISKGCSLSLVW